MASPALEVLTLINPSTGAAVGPFSETSKRPKAKAKGKKMAKKAKTARRKAAPKKNAAPRKRTRRKAATKNAAPKRRRTKRTVRKAAVPARRRRRARRNVSHNPAPAPRRRRRRRAAVKNAAPVTRRRTRHAGYMRRRKHARRNPSVRQFLASFKLGDVAKNIAVLGLSYAGVRIASSYVGNISLGEKRVRDYLGGYADLAMAGASIYGLHLLTKKGALAKYRTPILYGAIAATAEHGLRILAGYLAPSAPGIAAALNPGVASMWPGYEASLGQLGLGAGDIFAG